MPIYEYECPKCGRFDVVQKMSDAPLKQKPDCTEADCPCAAEKVISATSFHLKGSGWYKTDYSSSSTASTGASKSAGTAANTTTSSADAATGSKSESADSKSDSKSETKKAGGSGCGSGCGCH
jgi:putative FmdB family regulatory protein